MLEQLRGIGLTDGELRLYEALLEAGESTRTELARRSGISPSKIYDVANRLLEKGIISRVKKNGVLHFNAASPKQIFSYLDEKSREIEREREIVRQMLPRLEAMRQETRAETEVEVFSGWEGMRTVFDDKVDLLGPGDTDHIFGASQGVDSEQADIFFNRYYRMKERKGYATKIIFNEDVRGNEQRIAPFRLPPNELRFLHTETFTELDVFRDRTLIIMLLRKPIVIRVLNKEAADACRKFFHTLWEQARP